ncbi:MAG: alanine--tRNA ligase [Clostridiales bacterium]|nr:alanine--tRNA ligase [Clostridiales bacterium]
MKWTGLNELREKFLRFYESKGHLRLNSYPLIPQGDKSLLLINSGMAPMKKFFLGQETPPRKRVTTCQKCIRTPDIERVGKTSRHGTYFEMLGNFSFGDYFKHEATAWAWEFITKELELPVDRLWISIYENDDETFDIWTKEIGIPADRIVRLGKEDNFWEIGSGPCGPCSEIYFDRGEEFGCGKPDCGVGCDCDRFVEFWNLVFSQFNSDGNGNYAPMEHPNIDTGMGLERLACIMQQVDNLFEVDTVQNIMKHISQIAGVTYKEDEKTDVSLRVITDHIRSTTFMIADGVTPSNEGRGYVLRRLLRRAARHGRLLGIDEPFLYQVVDTVVKENEIAYPELLQKKEFIKKVIQTEEENFNSTIGKGMELLNQLIDRFESHEFSDNRLPGEQVFKLYDTFGFPIDLTKEILSEKNIELDESGFIQLMEQQKERARAARSKIGWSDDNEYMLTDADSVFVGYDTLEAEGEVIALGVNSERVEQADEGDKIAISLSKTPFYAESGGQLGDKGIMQNKFCKIEIYDCKKTNSGQFIHFGKIVSGNISQGQRITATVNKELREATMRNHTCAHLLQKALRDTLGDHVHQAGQQVDPYRLRFDFSHFNAMTKEELQQVEIAVNKQILAAVPVTITEKNIEEAKAMGAMALFGEKYGNIVRVVDVNGYSVELCGGTHVDNTAKIGLFKIISESSVASGIRRIEAVTGSGVLTLVNDINGLLNKVASVFKVSNPAELVAKGEAIHNEIKAKDAELAALNAEIADMKMNILEDSTVDINGVRVVSASFNSVKPDTLRMMGDKIKEKAPKMVAVIASIVDGKGTMIAVCGKEAIEKGAHAGLIIKEIAALAGGKGGGRPDSAMAGVSEIFKIDEALAQLPSVVQKLTEQ